MSGTLHRGNTFWFPQLLLSSLLLPSRGNCETIIRQAKHTVTADTGSWRTKHIQGTSSELDNISAQPSKGSFQMQTLLWHFYTKCNWDQPICINVRLECIKLREFVREIARYSCLVDVICCDIYQTHHNLPVHDQRFGITSWYLWAIAFVEHARKFNKLWIYVCALGSTYTVSGYSVPLYSLYKCLPSIYFLFINLLQTFAKSASG